MVLFLVVVNLGAIVRLLLFVHVSSDASHALDTLSKIDRILGVYYEVPMEQEVEGGSAGDGGGAGSDAPPEDMLALLDERNKVCFECLDFWIQKCSLDPACLQSMCSLVSAIWQSFHQRLNVRVRIDIDTCAFTYTLTHLQIHARVRTHTQIHTQTRSLTHAYEQLCTHLQTRERTPVTHKQTNNRTQNRTRFAASLSSFLLRCHDFSGQSTEKLRTC